MTVTVVLWCWCCYNLGCYGVGVVMTCRALWCGCCNNLGCYGVGIVMTAGCYGVGVVINWGVMVWVL